MCGAIGGWRLCLPAKARRSGRNRGGGGAGRELLPVAKVWSRVMIVHVIRCVTNPLERRCLQLTRGPEWRQSMCNGDRTDTTQLLLLGQTLEEINQVIVVTAVNCCSNESEHKLKKVIRWARSARTRHGRTRSCSLPHAAPTVLNLLVLSGRSPAILRRAPAEAVRPPDEGRCRGRLHGQRGHL
jgi:hypothetical protein